MTAAIELKNVTKRYHNKEAVSSLSFSLEKGEIFGLLGPNGAGKTSLLRMIMGILHPDEGEILFDGHPCTAQKRPFTGYLPEERGLYLKQNLLEMLVYFARLKGLEEKEALATCQKYLGRIGLTSYEKLRTDNLSKGMQQKVQLVVALLGEPEILILDEPFSGLDPVNVRMVKDILKELQGKGVSIILSTHQMNFVEELCDRILMLHQGKLILYGTLKEIQVKYSEHAILVEGEGEGDWKDFPEVTRTEKVGAKTKLVLDSQVSIQNFLQNLIQKKELQSFEMYKTPIEDIFIHLVEQAERT